MSVKCRNEAMTHNGNDTSHNNGNGTLHHEVRAKDGHGGNSDTRLGGTVAEGQRDVDDRLNVRSADTFRG